MARISKTKQLADIHAEALQEFDRIISVVRPERLQALKDRRFYSISGAQWEGALGEQFENKPKMEFNKIHAAIIRIINEYRNNNIGIIFVSKEGQEHDALADTCADLYRADEQDSNAQEAYNNAFEEGVGGGFGAFRLLNQYEDEENDEDERQRIRIAPIFDADNSVYFDLDAKRQDKKDAKRCFVLNGMTKEGYREEYGDNPASWVKQIMQTIFDWVTADTVYVAEYYRVEEVPELVHVYQDLEGNEHRYTDADFESNELLTDELAVQGAKKVREKKVVRKRVHKYIMSGSKILEDCGYIAGKYIPIVPFYGKRWFVDGVERFMGHVRLAKDAQMLSNMLRSYLAEIAALSPVEKPIFTSEQVAGHEMRWAEDNIKKYPFLTVNGVTDANGQPVAAGPIGYTKVPNIPPAMAALLQITEQDMRDILGNQEQGDKIVSNISEKAIQLVQQRLDMQTFIYMSNFAIAMRRAAEIWLSMASEVYVEEGRKMKGVGEQENIKQVELMRPVIDKESGETVYENDMSEAKFDVTYIVGPSSQSRRASTVSALTEMLAASTDPEVRRILESMILMNMEGEGISDARDYFRKSLVRIGVIKPTEEEQAQMMAEAQNAKPDPQSQYLMAEAERATAEAADLRAGTVKKIADAEQARAKTSEILANIDNSELEQLMSVLEKLSGIRNQTINPIQ